VSQVLPKTSGGLRTEFTDGQRKTNAIMPGAKK